MILNGTIGEGEALPSVRQVAAEVAVNPLTVTKAYQSLVDMGTVERRRGMGMFVTEGARAALLAHEKQKFLNEDWPSIAARIAALGLSIEDLLKDGESQ